MAMSLEQLMASFAPEQLETLRNLNPETLDTVVSTKPVKDNSVKYPDTRRLVKAVNKGSLTARDREVAVWLQNNFNNDLATEWDIDPDDVAEINEALSKMAMVTS